MKYLVFMQPFGLEYLIMANFIRIIVRKVWKNKVSLDIRVILVLCKAILILPFVTVHTQSEWPITYQVLSKVMLLPINSPKLKIPILFLMIEEVTIRIWNILIFLEETSTIQFLNFWGYWGIFEVMVVLLFLSSVFENLIWTQIVRQLP